MEKWREHFSGSPSQEGLLFLQISRSINRVMQDDLRINRMIVDRQRAADSATTLRDRSNRMKVGVFYLKEHHSIEFRRNGFLARGSCRIPQFKLAAESRTPVLVQVNQHN